MFRLRLWLLPPSLELRRTGRTSFFSNLELLSVLSNKKARQPYYAPAELRRAFYAFSLKLFLFFNWFSLTKMAVPFEALA